MKFLTNENVPRAAVDSLREAGHDVLWARSDMPGAEDVEILAAARDQHRVLITFDKDFGELAFRSRLPATSGIILIRQKSASPESAATRIRDAVASRQDWTGNYAVVDESRIRLRELPSI